MVAYIDDFVLMMVITIASAALLLLIRPSRSDAVQRRRPRAAGDAAAPRRLDPAARLAGRSGRVLDPSKVSEHAAGRIAHITEATRGLCLS